MTKLNDRIMRRQGRVRGLLRRAARERKRLSVYRSSKHIYAQVIDDDHGLTLASASSIEKGTRDSLKRRKSSIGRRSHLIRSGLKAGGRWERSITMPTAMRKRNWRLKK